jgi:tryptophan synthase alpha subunit
MGLTVDRPTATGAAIWHAVENAVMAGWTVERFMAVVEDAWAEARRDQAKCETETLRARQGENDGRS